MCKEKLALLILLFTVVSCSTIKEAATSQMGEMIFESSDAVLVENDWNLFEETISGNIKVLETLYATDRSNVDFIVTLIKGYTGKAFAIDETYYLKDQLQEKMNSVHRSRALSNYTRALSYSALFFKERDFENFDFTKYISSPDEFYKLLEDKLSDSASDVEGVFYTAQALASIINLQRDNMRTVAYLPLAKVMYDWSCEKNPKLGYGACDIFSASYVASRPRGLGGNPMEGKALFEKAIAKWPDNMMVRLAFIQFYAVPMYEKNVYLNQKLEIEKYTRENLESKYWSGGKLEAPEINYNNLFNLIANKRLEIIESLEKEIF